MSYIGLLGDVNRRQQSEDKQMQYLSALKSISDQKKEEGLKMQMAEQSFYESLNKQSEELLVYDKQKINEKAKLLQREVRDQIKMYGGSRTEFMNNGGASLMGGYINNVLGSDEFNQFKQNKQNMVMVLAALSNPQTSSLVSQKDINNLRSYESNKGGKITYSGLLPSIEMPNPDLYDYGSNIPSKDILMHGNNYNSIKARMIMEEYYVGDPKNITPEMVTAYFNTLKISGVGANTTKIKEQYDLAKKQLELENAYKTKALEKTNTDTDKDEPVFVTTELLRAKQQASESGLTNSQIFDAYDGDGNPADKLKKITGTDSLYGITSEINFDAPTIGLDEEGIDFTLNNKIWNGRFKIAGGRTVTNKVSQEVLSQIPGGYKISELGTITYDPGKSSNAYRYDGVKLTGKRKLEADEHAGEFRTLGIVSGYVGKTTEGNRNSQGGGQESILTVRYKKNGEIDKEYLKNAKDGYMSGTTEMKYFVALQDSETGAVFYEGIDIDNPVVQEALNNDLKELNISKTVKSQNKNQQQWEQQKAIIDMNTKIIKNEMAELDNSVFRSQNFNINVKKYVKPGTGTENKKGKLIKTMLMASAHDLDDKQAYLTSALIGGGVSILLDSQFKTEEVQNWNKSDEAFVDEWLKRMNTEEESESAKSNNTIMAEVWKNLLKM